MRRVTFTGVVEHHIQPHVASVGMSGGDQLGQLSAARIGAACVLPVHRSPHQRHVAPVVLGRVERVHRHQLDHVDPQVGEVGRAARCSLERCVANPRTCSS